MAHKKYDNPQRWGGHRWRAVRGNTVNSRRRIEVYNHSRARGIALRGRSNMTIRKEPWGGFNFPGPKRVKRAPALRQPGLYVKKVKAVRYKKGKKVKVSKTLRVKVNKVISGKEYHGYYQHTTYQFVRVQPVADTGANTQTVFQTNFENNSTEVMSPALVLNAASILWNGKAASKLTRIVADVGNFNPNEFKVEIRKAWATATITNNSQRRVFLKMFDCKAKNQQIIAFPQDSWQLGLDHMHSSKATIPLYSENPMNTLMTTLHAHPKSIPMFNENWKCECTSITLEPGQSYLYKIDGPTSTTMDMDKFYLGSVYQTINKFGRYIFGVAYLDLVTFGEVPPAGAPVASRGGEVNPRGGLDFEYNTYYCLNCPIKAGTVGVGAVGVGLELGEAHNAYSIQNDGPTLTSTMVEYRVDEMDPNPAENPPDV